MAHQEYVGHHILLRTLIGRPTLQNQVHSGTSKVRTTREPAGKPNQKTGNCGEDIRLSAIPLVSGGNSQIYDVES